MWRQKAFIKSYKYFEPGTFVTSCSELSGLPWGTIYKVKWCAEPYHYNDVCVASLEGRDHPVPTFHLTNVQS